MRRKTGFILIMAALCVMLYTIVSARAERTTNIIFGGADGAYVTTDSYSMADPNAVTPEPTVNIWPDIDITGDDGKSIKDQYSMIRDSDNCRLSPLFEPKEVSEINREYTAGGTTMLINSNIVEQLEAMVRDARAAGHSCVINAAYRSYSYQEQLFNGKASQIALGMGIDDYLDPDYQLAVEEARTITMYPGTSEHQLGLAVDIMDRGYSRMVYANMDQELFAWLDEHCCEYGFIKRYPTRKMLLTGWDEPWHYRYVGVEAATFIMQQGISFEEFYAHYDTEFQY